jgi:YidC/Oxa1 family membrane protein insertase
VGPKDVETLGQVDRRLEQLIDWGWFWWVAKPLFGGVMQVHKWVRTWAPSGAYGWALIIVTIIINFALLPLKISALKSSKKMSALQPDIARINKKYEGIGLQDPRRNQQNEEIMGLYKKHNVNPVGGCVPLLLQMPFLFAFLQVLQVAVQMRQADWLWVKDLSQPETIPIRLLPLAMVATQFILQRMTPTPSVDPAQQRMLQLMPLMFAVFFYNAQSGLVLYWLVGNLIALVQQWAFNKFL